MNDIFSRHVQDAVSHADEFGIPARISLDAGSMVLPIYFDHETERRGENVYDAASEDDLPAERNPESASAKRVPEYEFGEGGR